LGSKRAWLWLADANPTTAASVFGVEKDQIINLTVHQHKEWNSAAGTDILLSTPTATANFHQNNWGVATFTHSGASATLLGASAVMVALVSFF
jgi:hypothetical protein